MANVLFRRGKKSDITNTTTSPIIDGQVLYTTDQGDGKNILYADVDNKRIRIAGAPVDTKISKTSTNAVENQAITNYVDDRVDAVQPRHKHTVFVRNDRTDWVYYDNTQKYGFVLYHIRKFVKFEDQKTVKVELTLPKGIMFGNVPVSFTNIHTSFPRNKYATLNYLGEEVTRIEEPTFTLYCYADLDTVETSENVVDVVIIGDGIIDESRLPVYKD